MFNFFSMMGNYEDRKVGRYEVGDLLVSTAYVTDSSQPYETAVAHPLYNDGKIIIVEQYDDKQQAKSGHERWVSIMTAPTLPASLTDVSTAGIIQLGSMILGKGWHSEPKMRQDFLDVTEGDYDA